MVDANVFRNEHQLKFIVCRVLAHVALLLYTLLSFKKLNRIGFVGPEVYCS